MDLQHIIKKLNTVSQDQYVKFILESDGKCCKKCRQYKGMIFKENDPSKPELPLHPNCRCKYVSVSNTEVSSIKNRLFKVQDEVSAYSRLLTQEASDLATEAETFLAGATANDDRTDWLLKGAKASALIVLIQSALFNIEKIITTNKELKNLYDVFIVVFPDKGIEPPTLEIMLDMLAYCLKNLHYSRLLDEEQRLENLPASPEEALKRGFTLAPDSQSRYHRNNGEMGNQKYYHEITGQEVVFNEKGRIVTSHENIGTKNYGPDPISKEHLVLDVLPYWIWGNTEDDTTPLLKRIFGN